MSAFDFERVGSASKGAISGAIAGLAYGAVFAVIGYVTLLSEKATVIAQIAANLPTNSTFTPDQLFSSALEIAPFLAVVVGVAGGVVLGAIYGWIFERIPGKRTVTKGLIFSIIYWTLFSVVGGLGSLQYGIGYYITEMAIGFATSILFGLLLSRLYGRLALSGVVDRTV